jgi:hypothetical protein
MSILSERLDMLLESGEITADDCDRLRREAEIANGVAGDRFFDELHEDDLPAYLIRKTEDNEFVKQRIVTWLSNQNYEILHAICDEIAEATLHTKGNESNGR